MGAALFSLPCLRCGRPIGIDRPWPVEGMDGVWEHTLCRDWQSEPFPWPKLLPGLRRLYSALRWGTRPRVGGRLRLATGPVLEVFPDAPDLVAMAGRRIRWIVDVWPAGAPVTVVEVLCWRAGLRGFLQTLPPELRRGL